jgi:hypothetical protein
MKNSFIIFLISVVSFSSSAQSVNDQLSALNADFRAWVESTCPISFGPSLYSNCIRREVSAVKAGIPTTDGLSQADKAWVESTCPISFGPSLYSNCIRREVGAIKGI